MRLKVNQGEEGVSHCRPWKALKVTYTDVVKEPSQRQMRRLMNKYDSLLKVGKIGLQISFCLENNTISNKS